MLRLTSIIFSLAGTALAGAFVTAALASGFVTAEAIIYAAAAGAALGLPVSFLVARQLTRA